MRGAGLMARQTPWQSLVPNLPISATFSIKNSFHSISYISVRIYSSNSLGSRKFSNNTVLFTKKPLFVAHERSYHLTVCRSAHVTPSTPAVSTSTSNPKYSRLLPCPSEALPPRIEHLIVQKTGNVVDIISEALDIPRLYVKDLILFGAVHYALVCPILPSTATAEQVELYKKVTSPSVLKDRISIKGKTVREAQKTFRINDATEVVEEGSYMRIHVHPKRFPRSYQVDWHSRVIAETESYVVLDKPVGTSVGGTTDNIYETCANFTTRAIGLKTPLRTTHQLDNCTEGCVVLSKTLEFCSEFHSKFRERQIKKLYLALTTAYIPPGKLIHYMRPVNVVPRIVRREFTKGWQLCELEVLECKEVPWPSSTLQASAFIEGCGWPSREVAYECKVDLLTGRTHQIRAQFADIGAPVVGDTIYMAAAISRMKFPNIYPFKQDNVIEDINDESVKAAIDEWILQHGSDPPLAIGLQACQISWDNGRKVYKAHLPWWRTET